jgi:hypothetical protein
VAQSVGPEFKPQSEKKKKEKKNLGNRCMDNAFSEQTRNMRIFVSPVDANQKVTFIYK